MPALFLVFFSAALSCLALPHQQCLDNTALVDLPSGRYFGHHDARASVTTYYSIPYARSERFEVAKPIDTVGGLSPDATVNASKHGAACINFGLPPPYDVGFGLLLGDTPIEPQSEDCLTMDITVPDGDYQHLPVLFYTPGGGFLVGASFTYDMSPIVARSRLVGKPVIGVSINYRLGPLGFLNPNSWHESGKVNLGMLDQIEALRFVKKYIHSFGGDSHRVTISGESAGADSTMQQLLWTQECLFRSAWLMSTPSTDGPFLEPRPQPKDDLMKDYAKACACSNPDNSTTTAIECLRTTSVDVMTEASGAWQGSGSSLGGFVKERAFDAIEAGRYPKIPIVVSVCRDEGTNTAIGFQSDNDTITSLVLYNYIEGRELKGRDAEDFLTQMLQAYPTDPTFGAPFDGRNTTYGEPSQYKRMSAIASDAPYTAPWRYFLETFSQKTNIWGIVFEEPIPGVSAAFGVQHGSDLPFYFPELLGEKDDLRRNGYADLVDTVHDALINFVSDGDPNGARADCGAGGYRWPEYGDSGMVTALNASDLATSVNPPYRPGFEVIQRYLIEGPGEVWA